MCWEIKVYWYTAYCVSVLLCRVTCCELSRQFFDKKEEVLSTATKIAGKNIQIQNLVVSMSRRQKACWPNWLQGGNCILFKDLDPCRGVVWINSNKYTMGQMECAWDMQWHAACIDMQHVATKQMEKTQKHGSTLFICLTWEAAEVAGLLEESEATTASSKTLRIGGHGHVTWCHMSWKFSWRVLCIATSFPTRALDTELFDTCGPSHWRQCCYLEKRDFRNKT